MIELVTYIEVVDEAIVASETVTMRELLDLTASKPARTLFLYKTPVMGGPKRWYRNYLYPGQLHGMEPTDFIPNVLKLAQFLQE